MINLLRILKSSWSYLLFFAIGAYCGFHVGLMEIHKLKEIYTQERNALITEVVKEKQCNEAINRTLSLELAKKQTKLMETEQQLEWGITDAIKNDGHKFNGIGTDSLCLYKQAFGYDCPRAASK